MKVIIYCRVSTEIQASEGVSLEAQRIRCEGYAAAMEHAVVGHYSEVGSGKDLDREGLQRALQDIAEGKADGLLIYKLDRLTRNLKNLGELLEGPFAVGVAELISVTDRIDTQTANGRLMLNLIMSVLQWERETISERTTEGIQHLKTTGQRYCNRVYGKIPTDDGMFVDNPHEIAIIRHIQLLKSQGLGFQRIANELNGAKIQAPSGKYWHPMTVKRILDRVQE